MHTLKSRFIAFTILLLLPAFSYGATLYVEKWGVDVAPCKKAAPCLTIQFAIDEASPNSKVVVGPGTYAENLIIATLGLKLESTAGRYATTLEASATFDDALIISAIKVKIGKKGKGFTFNSSLSGIYIDVSDDFPGIKIEGNRMGHPRGLDDTANGGFSLERGLYVDDGGGKLSVRNNIFQNIQSTAFFCRDCNNALIKDNRFESGGGVAINVGASEKVSILNNVISRNAGFGLRTSNTVVFSKVKDNAVERNNHAGIHIENADGVLAQSNIFSKNGFDGAVFFQPSNTKPMKVKSNLVLDNGSGGVFISTAQNAVVENNIMINNSDDGLALSGGATVASLKNNATIDSGACGIDGISAATIYNHIKHFFSNNVDNTCNGDFSSGTTSTKPVAVKVNKAAKLVGG